MSSRQDRDAAATVADRILTSTQKGPDPWFRTPSTNNGPQSDAPIKRWRNKDERPVQ
jgi:hypothetical protein